MVKRYEYTKAYVVIRVDRFHRADLPVANLVTAIEAVPTISEAWAERDRLNAVARGRGIDTEYIASGCRSYPEGRGIVPADAHPPAIGGTWIWPGNVEALLETLSRWIGYAFDDDDRTAVEHGLVDSDADADRWFEYPLAGEVRLDVRLARNVGADPVSIEVRSADPVGDELRARIDTALELSNCYRLVAPPRQD